MRSTNPVFTRNEQFQTLYPQPRATQPMTMDSVVQTTAIALTVVFALAGLTWVFTPDLTRSITPAQEQMFYAVLMTGSLGAFVLSWVNALKRVVSPALVLGFCVLEGVALGGLSKYFDASFGSGVVTSAVMGTFAAFIGTLAAYKFFDIKVTPRFKMFTISAMFSVVVLSLLETVLLYSGAGMGIYAFNTTGLLFAVVGLILGIFSLVLDFDFVEQGIKNGLEERESWRAAFGITVSLVWIYTNLLRILAMANRS